MHYKTSTANACFPFPYVAKTETGRSWVIISYIIVATNVKCV